MASYRIISPTLWQDPEFRQLPPMAGYMLVQLRLMATNIIALYKPDWELIGELTRLDRAGRKASLAELGKPKASGSPWVLHEDGYAWIVNGFRHEFGFDDDGRPLRPNGKQCVAIQRALAGVPRHVTLVQQFASHYACPDYPELDRVLIPYRQGMDTVSIQPDPETGPGNRKPETGNRKLFGRDGSETARPDKSSPASPSDPKAEENAKCVQLRNWFAARYRKVNGADIPGFDPDDRRMSVKDRNACRAILAMCRKDREGKRGYLSPAELDRRVYHALSGNYYKIRPPSSVAEFKMVLANCTDKALRPAEQRKAIPGTSARPPVNETPGSERSRYEGHGGFKPLAEILPNAVSLDSRA